MHRLRDKNFAKLNQTHLVASRNILTVFTSHQLYTNTLDEQLAQQEVSLSVRTILTAVEAVAMEAEGSLVCEISVHSVCE